MIKEFVEKVKANKKKILKQALVIGATIGGTLLTVKLLNSNGQHQAEGEEILECLESANEEEVSEQETSAE